LGRRTIMGKEPLVSVIVPLYNYSMYIGDCIKSIQNQDYKNWELFVVDDCSTDNSYDIAKSFESDERIKVMKTEINSGYSKAKNEGIIASKGELLTFLDADDMFLKNSISIRVKALRDNDVPFVHAKAIVVKGGISLEQAYNIPDGKKYKNARIHAQTILYERWIHKKFGLYDEDCRSKADKEMWFRLFGWGLKSPKIKRHFIKKNVAYYRKHNNSMMKKRRRNPKLQKRVTAQLKASYEMRLKKIDITNTRFLEN